MRQPAFSYRTLFYGMTAVAAAAGVVALIDARLLRQASAENARLARVTEFVAAYPKYRDHDFDFTVTNYGFTYQGRTGSLVDDEILKCGAWEKFMLFFLEDYVRAAGARGTAFVDVGANTGVHSMFMATRITEVHAVEPYPPVLERLHGHIALNKFDNVRVHEVGFGDTAATLPFFAPVEDNHGTGSFRNGDHLRQPAGEMTIVAADDYLGGVTATPIGIVKIDIEGYEEAALKGFRRTFEAHRPLVVVEVTTRPQGTIGSFDQLRGLFPENYEFFAFVEDGRAYLGGDYELLDFGPMAAEFFASDAHCNVVAVPAERVPVLPRSRGSN